MELQDIISTIKDNNFTSYQIAQSTGLSQPGIDKILNGDSKNPRRATLNILENFINEKLYNKTPEVILIGGEAPEVIQNEFLENSNSNQFIRLENGQYLMTMPLAEIKLQAGFLDHYQDLEYLNSLGKHSIIVDNPVKGRYVAFRVDGTSMDDGTSNAILPNSIVTTRELQRHHWTSKLRYKDFPYWVIYTSQSRYPLLKEIVEHDIENGTLTCHSLNEAPEYTDFKLKLDDINALFYVVDVHRNVSRKLNY